MAILLEQLNGVGNGTTLTTGNTSYNAVGSGITADTSQASSMGIPVAARIPASSVNGQLKWNGLSTTDFLARWLVCYPVLMGADHWMFSAEAAGSRAITLGYLGSFNKLRLYTAAGTGTTIWTAANAFVATRCYRIEVYMSGLSASTATVKVRMFSGATPLEALSGTATPVESYDGTGVSNTGTTNIDTINFAKVNTVTLAQDLYVGATALNTAPAGDQPWPLYTVPTRIPAPSRAVARAANY